jgi:hypothetical protein
MCLGQSLTYRLRKSGTGLVNGCPMENPQAILPHTYFSQCFYVLVAAIVEGSWYFLGTWGRKWDRKIASVVSSRFADVRLQRLIASTAHQTRRMMKGTWLTLQSLCQPIVKHHFILQATFSEQLCKLVPLFLLSHYLAIDLRAGRSVWFDGIPWKDSEHCPVLQT